MLAVLMGYLLIYVDFLSLPAALSLLIIMSGSLLAGWSGQFYMLLSGWAATDQLSSVLVLLVAMSTLIAFYSASEEEAISMGMLIMISGGVSVMVFLCADLFMFFFMFEASLVPMFAMIVGWGYQPERVQAAISMLLYTSVGSLPLFLFISHVAKFMGTDKMALLKLSGLQGLMDWFMWTCALMAFLIKMPMFGLHGWLPKAHVEAPVTGSVILAGVMLKFGGYGMMRFMWAFKWCCLSPLSDLLLIAAVWGGFVSACLCAVQADVKSLIAYSSVSHMSVVLAGVLSCTGLGWSAALALMMSHGLSSPILFSAANYSYDVYQSRSVVLSKGLLKMQPLLTLVWLLGFVVSAPVPPSCGFFAELGLISASFMQSMTAGAAVAMMCFMAFVYSFYLYTSITHGGLSSVAKSSSEEKGFGFLVLFLAVFFTIAIAGGLDLFFLG
uniref:NADH dehydrogenase subunit 4 n=1 Tax=Hippopus porcellanus TaxID=80819 RepID=UPI00226C70EB|nr:NADH dehydrogenase subunit 4 [Hippopus porcellanus]UZM09096.1 NADH dehydrogenase subunit 4 [Hippopus porcellanus]